MTNRISVDSIEELARFRAHLVEFNRNLGDNIARIRNHWGSLSSVWSDDMYRRLGDALDEVTPGIDRYLANTSHHEAYLEELIQRLRAVTEVHGGWS